MAVPVLPGHLIEDDHSKELNCLHRSVAICDETSNLAIQFDSNVRATEFLHSTVLLAVCGSAEAVDCPKTVKGSRSIGALKMRDLGTVKGPHLGCRSRTTGHRQCPKIIQY
ncbi:hypothetical protein T02_13981 [Trichinella nativa]|uniref:Uncharacterized protein n=1 Tax=Trichinella nativa TaxID=6335 RepID=A0A0V1LC17_9BILA|nr:hypothetical protein T02_13981 [Trichinella nativa]